MRHSILFHICFFSFFFVFSIPCFILFLSITNEYQAIAYNTNKFIVFFFLVHFFLLLYVFCCVNELCVCVCVSLSCSKRIKSCITIKWIEISSFHKATTVTAAHTVCGQLWPKIDKLCFTPAVNWEISRWKTKKKKNTQTNTTSIPLQSVYYFNNDVWWH